MVLLFTDPEITPSTLQLYDELIDGKQQSPDTAL